MLGAKLNSGKSQCSPNLTNVEIFLRELCFGPRGKKLKHLQGVTLIVAGVLLFKNIQKNKIAKTLFFN